MRAKLFIKGDKEPIELEYMEGKEAERILNDVTCPDDTRFSVIDVVNTTKKEMRYVKFVSEPTYVSKEITSEMGDVEFKAMQIEMKVCDFDAETEGFKYGGKDWWLQSKKVLRLDFKENWQFERYYDRVVLDPEGFTRLQDTMELYDRRISKIEFAKKKELEHLTKVAEQSEIKK